MSLLSSIVAPLQPYLLLVKLAGALAIAGVLFVGGCRHGESIKADEVAEATKYAQSYLEAANACGDALGQVSEETKRAEQKAAEWKAAADAAGARATESHRQMQAAQSAAAGALEKAKATPTCAAQLAMTLCPEVPVL